MIKSIWSFKNFHELKLTLKYLWRSKAVQVQNLENKREQNDCPPDNYLPENCRPDNCPSNNCSARIIAPLRTSTPRIITRRIVFPRTIALRIIVPRIISTRKIAPGLQTPDKWLSCNCPQIIFLLVYCHLRQQHLRQLP